MIEKITSLSVKWVMLRGILRRVHTHLPQNGTFKGRTVKTLGKCVVKTENMATRKSVCD